MQQSIPIKFLLSFIIFTLIFRFYPQIDIQVSQMFFDSDLGFFPFNTEHNITMYIGDICIQLGSVIWICGMLFFARRIYSHNLRLKNIAIKSNTYEQTYLIAQNVKHRIIQVQRFFFDSSSKRKMTYVILVGILGSLIAVYSTKFLFQRIRPQYINEFNGQYQFTKAWEHNNRNNAGYQDTFSFVSGHSAIGFLIYSIAFLYDAKSIRRKKFMIISTIIGGIFGLFRVIQGKHFISDVVFSGYIMYGSALILSYIIKPYLVDKPSNVSKF